MAKRSAVINFIEDHPSATLDELCERFPTVSRERLKAALERYQRDNPPAPPDPAPEEMERETERIQQRNEEWQRSPEHAEAQQEHREHMGVMHIIWDLAKNHPDKLVAALPYIPVKDRLESLTRWLDEAQKAQQRQESPFDENYAASGPTRKVTLDMVVGDYEAFKAACERKEMSVRRALHIAMKAFTEQYGGPESKVWF